MFASLRLIVYDDNQHFRESLLQLFRYTPDLEVLADFPEATDILKHVRSLQPDVILMDIDMPGINGIEATARLKEVFPAVQVVILTVSEEEERIFQALRNGATGYLLKKAGPEEIVDAVRSVYQGGSPMSPAIARKVLRFFQSLSNETISPAAIHSEPPSFQPEPGTIVSPGSTLTPRELEILEALVDGLSYKMIATRHFISPDTVKNHIQGIYRKLHVNSKGEAISFALRSGIAGKRF